MRRFWFRSLLTLTVVLSLLTARIGSVSHVAFVEPIQNFISKKAVFQENDPRQKAVFLKLKRSFHELPPGELLLLTVPPAPIGYLLPLARTQSLPEVYLEIFDPPDNLS